MARAIMIVNIPTVALAIFLTTPYVGAMQKARTINPERATRILGLLGWSRAEFMRRFNKVTGRNIGAGDGWRWFKERGLSGEASVFLRMALRIAVLERRLRGVRRR